jgi:hypothetical protein
MHRGRAALPGWAPVRVEETVSFDPELRTASEVMAQRWEAEREHLTDEALLIGAVRSWVEFLLPGDTLAANAAAGIALEQLNKTGSAADAFAQARQFIGSWMRHPSHFRVA